MSESTKRHTKPPKNDEGRMPLGDHLRELRNRLFVAVIAVLVLSIVGWIIFDPVMKLLTDPACRIHIHGIAKGRIQGCESGVLTMTGVLAGLSFHFKIAFIVGVILAAPVWSYQIWAFIAPGLYKKEKKYGLGFAGAAVPLFLLGVALCYWMLPKALNILLSFVPDSFAAQLPADQYLDFLIRMFLVFGLSFELPVLLVALNFIGVLSGKRLVKWWRGAIVIIFVFAAIATPTGDPFTMCALALPISVLYIVATLVALANDKRRERANPDHALDDDEASSIDDYLNDHEDDTDDSGSLTPAEVTASEIEPPQALPAPRRSDYANDEDIT